MNKQNDETISLNKFISSSGLCSRREADKIIEAGRVMLNGKRGKLGNRVGPRDSVKVDGRSIQGKPETIYLAFHKPMGLVSTTDVNEKNSIINYIHYPQRLFPVGRLDKDSQGLIFLTNDGDIVNKILRAGNKHEKEYSVTVDQSITEEFIHKMSSGIPMLGTVTKKCKVEKTGPRSFKIILTQGLNRQIRRMCEFLGFEVVQLKRIRIMNVKLEKLPEGEWRPLTEVEIGEIQEAIKQSSKTEEASKDKNKQKRNFSRKQSPSSSPFKPKKEGSSSKKTSSGGRIGKSKPKPTTISKYSRNTGRSSKKR
jgi:23S rRNA pseudouridine2604 synthase